MIHRRSLVLLLAGAALAGGATVAVVRAVGGEGCGDAFATRPPAVSPADPDEASSVRTAVAAAGYPVRWTARVDALPYDGADVTVAGDTVVLRQTEAGRRTSLQALAAATGAPRWRRRLDRGRSQVLPLDDATAVAVGSERHGGAVRLGVVAADGRLVACRSFPHDDPDSHITGVAVGGDGHRIVVASPEPGGGSRIELLEGASLTSKWVVSVPMVANGVAVGEDLVVATVLDNHATDQPALMGLDAATGARRWQHSYEDLPSLTGRPLRDAFAFGWAHIAGGRVTLTVGLRQWGSDELLHPTPLAVRSSDGAALWHRPDLELLAPDDLVATADLVVVTGETAAAVVGLDPADGVERWRAPGAGGLRPPARGARSWFLAGGPGALDPRTGTVVPLADGRRAFSVATTAGLAVYSLDHGLVVALDDPA